MQISATGIVIRERSVGDDRLVGVLTRERGVLDAFARGAKKPRGKLTSSTELFCYCSFNFFSHRDSVTVDSAEVHTSFFELRRDLTALSLASYIAELAYELAPREEEAPDYLRLVLNCLHLLKTGGRTPPLVKAVYEMRLLTMAGFMPDLAACSVCGAFEGGDMRFDITSGALFCPACAARAPGGAATLSPGVLASLRHILYSPFEKLFSFTLSAGGTAALGAVCERYLKYHLARGFSSLEFYHSVADG